MAYQAEITYTASAGQTNFTIPFDYMQTGDVKVSVDGSTTVTYTVNGTTLTISSPTLAGGESVRIYRQTPATLAGQRVNFQGGSTVLTERVMDDFYKQLLFIMQERDDQVQRAEIESGNLPTVGTNEGDMLRFVSGAWSTIDPSTLSSLFGVELAKWDLATSIPILTTANWYEDVNSQRVVSNLQQSGSFATTNSTTAVQLEAGTYLLWVNNGIRDSGGGSAQYDWRLTDAVNGPTQVTHFIGLSIPPSNSFLRFGINIPVFLTFNAATDVVFRHRANNATSTMGVEAALGRSIVAIKLA